MDISGEMKIEPSESRRRINNGKNKAILWDTYQECNRDVGKFIETLAEKFSDYQERMQDLKKAKKDLGGRTTKELQLFDCLLKRAPEGRCEKSCDCPHYAHCVNETSLHHWRGWRAIPWDPQ